MLTERRKADREEMARQIRALCAELGAEVDETALPRGVAIEIEAPGGLCVHVLFEGDSCQPDVHVIPWFTRSGARLVPAFGEVNPHHFGKATHVAHGSEALLAELRRGLSMACDGTAYQAPDDDDDDDTEPCPYHARDCAEVAR